MSGDLVIIILTFILIAIGSFYRYRIIKAKFELGYYILFLFICYPAAIGIVYFIGALAFIADVKLFGYTVENMKPIIFIGGLGSLVASLIFFFNYLSNKTNQTKIVKKQNKQNKT